MKLRLSLWAARLLFAALSLLLGQRVLASVATGYVTVYGSNLQDSTGALVANATITFAPVNSAGQPVSFRLGTSGQGQAVVTPPPATVTNGVFSIVLADTSLTNPANICYNVTVVDNVTGNSLLGPGYGCVQPQATTTSYWCSSVTISCNFDQYIPNTAAGSTIETGPVGPGFRFRGAWAPSTNYAAMDVLTYLGTTYEVPTAFTSGATFSASPLVVWAESGSPGTPYIPLLFGATCNWDPATGMGADDTAALSATLAAAVAGKGYVFIPGGDYCTSSVALQADMLWVGAGSSVSGLVYTGTTGNLLNIAAGNPSNPNASVARGAVGVKSLALYGGGKTTTGTLLDILNETNVVLDDVQIVNHGGIGLLLSDNTERLGANNLYIAATRWPIVNAGQGNEMIFTNTRIVYAGISGVSAADSTNEVWTWCYTENCVGGAIPSGTPGNPFTVYPSHHFAITSVQNGAAMRFSGLSIKPQNWMGGVQIINGAEMSLDSYYAESGYVNVGEADGGSTEGTAIIANTALSSTGTTFNVNSTEWFPIVFDSQANLTSYGEPVVGVIAPPDYVPNSTAASVLGGGITQGSHEYVSINGCYGNSCVLSVRGQQNTTALNWPSGFVFQFYSSYPTMRISNSNLNSNEDSGLPQDEAPYYWSFSQDDSQCRGSREIIVGSEPCANYSASGPIIPVYQNINTFVSQGYNQGQTFLYLDNDVTLNSFATLGANETQGSILGHGPFVVNFNAANSPVLDNFNHDSKLDLTMAGFSQLVAAQYPNGGCAYGQIQSGGKQIIMTCGTDAANKQEYFWTGAPGFTNPVFTLAADNGLLFGLGDVHPVTPILTPTTGGTIPPETVFVRAARTEMGTGSGDCAGCGPYSPPYSQITYTAGVNCTNGGHGSIPAGQVVRFNFPGCPGATGYGVTNGEKYTTCGPGEVCAIIIDHGALCTSSSASAITVATAPANSLTGFCANITPLNATIEAPSASKAITLTSGQTAFTVSAPGPDSTGRASGYKIWVGTGAGEEIGPIYTSSVTTPTTVAALPTGTPVPVPECEDDCGPMAFISFTGMPGSASPTFALNWFNPSDMAFDRPWSITPALETTPNILDAGLAGAGFRTPCVDPNGNLIVGSSCPTGSGTITEVSAGSGITGGGSSGAVTVNIDATKVPLLASSSNIFAGALSAASVQATGLAGTGYRTECVDPSGNFVASSSCPATSACPGAYQQIDIAPGGALAGAINNSNEAYTLSQTPTGAVSVSYNGLPQGLGANYTVVGTSLVLNFGSYPPYPGDTLEAKYCTATLAASTSQPAPSVAPTPANLTVSDTEIASVSGEYVGPSIEKASIVESMFEPSETVAPVFAELGSKLVRIGGGTADTMIWNPSGSGQTAGQVSPTDLSNLNSFLVAAGMKAIYTINLAEAGASQSTTLAAQEAAAVASALGSNLEAFAIGNEIDNYGVSGHPSPPTTPWTEANYQTLWNSYRSAIIAAVPSAQIDGPDLDYSTSWFSSFVSNAGTANMYEYTAHWYTDFAANSAATTSELLTPTSAPNAAFSGTYLPALKTAAATTGLPFRIDETNSFADTYESSNPIATTYAATLWLFDDIYRNLAGGSSGINLHGGFGSDSLVSTTGTTVASLGPLYYSTLLWNMAGTGNFVTGSLTTSLNATVIPIQTSSGHSILVSNKDSSQPMALTIAMPSTVHSASLTLMSQAANSLSAVGGVTIQFAAPSLSGSFTPGLPYVLTPSGDTVFCYVPALSVALIKTN